MCKEVFGKHAGNEGPDPRSLIRNFAVPYISLDTEFSQGPDFAASLADLLSDTMVSTILNPNVWGVCCQ